MSDAQPPTGQDDREDLRARIAQLEAEVARARELEDRLRFVESRRQSHLADTPVAVIFWDTDFEVLEWNPAAERIFGYTSEEAIGRNVLDLVVHPDARAHVEQVVRQLLQQRGGRHSVNDNITKDGQRIRCEWFNTPVVIDGQGEVIGVVSLAQDVTEQWQTEQTLRRSEGMLRSILEHAPDIVLCVNREARITYANRMEPNYTREQVMGQSVYDFVIPEHQHIVRGAVETAFATGESAEYEVQDAVNRHWFQTRLAPIVEEDEVTSVVIICLDVHDRKVEHEQLIQQQQVFKVLAENVPGVVYLCANDERYTMRYLSDAVEDLLGIPADQFLRDRVSFVDLYHPHDASVIPPAVDAAVARRAPFHLVYRLKHAQGHWIWVEEHGQGVFDEDGQLRFLEGTLFDITEKRRAEEALRRSEAELKTEVDARTQELRTANRLLREDYKRQLQLTRELRESEEKFRVMSENSPAPILIARISDAKILYANARCAEMLGVPLGELLGRSGIEFYQDPGDREPLFEHLRKHGFVRDHEVQLKRSDGMPLWVSASLRRLTFQDEDAVMSSFLDITERRDLIEQLKSERRLLRRLLDLHQRDRQLIAYEIHDGFVQDVTGAIMHLQSASSDLADADGARHDLDFGINVLRDSIDEARRLIDGLQPGVLEQQGVAAAVRFLAEQTEKLHGIHVKLELDVRFDRLAPAVEMAVYRIVQEGLNNIVKHSKSPQARVVLSQREDSLVIKVDDWGKGFDTKKVKARRYGLTGISDRARLLGGKAKIRSKPGEGTQLRVKLPLKDVLLPDNWQPTGLEDDDSSSNWMTASDSGEGDGSFG